MNRRTHLIWGALGASVAGFFYWQNHQASERMAALVDRVERVAQKAAAQPAPQVVTREILVEAPTPSPSQASTATATATPPTEAPPAVPVPDPARREKLVRAQERTDDIIRSGVLEPEAVRALGADLATLPREEALAIRARIALALNKQELIPTQIPFELP